MRLRFTSFDDLDTRTLYALIKLRVDVFVVEQACPYPELDGLDTLNDTIHVLGYLKGDLVAYARILESHSAHIGLSDTTSDPIRIGRVVVAQGFRGQGYARSLMQAILEHILRHHPHRLVQLSAQTAVQQFYKSLGFKSISSPYLEDDIEHIDMQLHRAR